MSPFCNYLPLHNVLPYEQKMTLVLAHATDMNKKIVSLLITGAVIKKELRGEDTK